MAGNFSEKALGSGGRKLHFQVGSGSTDYFNTYGNERSMGMLHSMYKEDSEKNNNPEAASHHYAKMATHAKKGARMKAAYRPESRMETFTQARSQPSVLRALYN